MKRLAFLLVPLLLLACGGGARDDEAGGSAAEMPAGSAKRPEGEAAGGATDEEPLSIDPDREEEYRHGTPAERLLAKYALLIERIRIERDENVYNSSRTMQKGLVPLAKEHHRFRAEGVFDSTLTLGFIQLAQFVLLHHILQDDDPTGRKARTRIDEIRGLLAKHETPGAAAGASTTPHPRSENAPSGS